MEPPEETTTTTSEREKVLRYDSLIQKSPYNSVDLLDGLKEAAGRGISTASILATAVAGETKLSYIYLNIRPSKDSPATYIQTH